ncbi:MAG: LPS export ABC transporter permease LptF [Francisellaceae bacterium]
MILLRYINRELINTTLAIILILLVIVISNFFVRYLSIVSGGNVEASLIFKSISVMMPKYIAYLIPISFFFAVLLVFGKLYANNELTVTFACGLSWGKLLKIVMIPAASLFVIELILTMVIMPKMDQGYYLVQKTTAKNSLVSFIEPGKIISFNDGKQVVYTQSTDNDGNMHNIFIYQKQSQGHAIILTAPIGYAETDKDGSQFFVLKNGNYYESSAGKNALQKGSFKTADQYIAGKVILGENTSIDSVPTSQLFGSDNPKYNAELQWRLSFPLAILIATLIAMVIGRMRPRQNRYSKIIPAIIVFILYFNFISLSKSWISDGNIPTWIGIWWVHLIFGGGALFILKRYNGAFIDKRREKA